MQIENISVLSVFPLIKRKVALAINWTCILCEISISDLILQMCCSLRNTQSPEGLLCLKRMKMYHLYSYQSHAVLIKIQTATSEKLLFEEGNLPHNVTVPSVNMQ